MDAVQRTIAPLILSLLAACSLYGGDDEPLGPDAGTVQVDGAATSATYAVTWECMAAECDSPIATTDRATVMVDSGTVRVDWYRNGDPVNIAAHDGATAEDCFAFPRDSEAIERSAYSLCPVIGAPAPALGAEIAWGDSRWSVTLAPL